MATINKTTPIKDFLFRLTSRKFLLTVASGLTAVANGQYHAAWAVVVAYIGSEGLGDAVERYAAERTKQIKASLAGSADDMIVPGHQDATGMGIVAGSDQ
jgi:hypothetical protein